MSAIKIIIAIDLTFIIFTILLIGFSYFISKDKIYWEYCPMIYMGVLFLFVMLLLIVLQVIFFVIGKILGLW